MGAADVHVWRHLENTAAVAGKSQAGFKSSMCAKQASFCGVLGHIRGATLIPLGSESRAKSNRDQPVVAVCRSGARSLRPW
jgi:hypothetical protein